MTFHAYPCPACATPAIDHFVAIDENRRIASTAFHYQQCPNCHVLFLTNIPDDLGRYYQDAYYAIPTLPALDAVAEKDPAKINTVRAHATSGRLLEVGPAFGVFAWQAKQAGFIVDVIEMDARCCDFLNNTLGVNAVNSDIPEQAIHTLPAHDVIALWHVFEHLPRSFAFLEAAAKNLAPGGVLILAMPNPEAFQFRLMGKHWPHLDAPRHVTLIPSATLTAKAAALGLERVSITTDDSDARSWNRFGWQRLLMNRFSGKFMQRVMFIAGWGLSWMFAPWDRRAGHGSAYTIVFRKPVAL